MIYLYRTVLPSAKIVQLCKVHRIDVVCILGDQDVMDDAFIELLEVYGTHVFGDGEHRIYVQRNVVQIKVSALVCMLMLLT